MPESVWDYPRPPRVEQTPRRIRVLHDGVALADSTRADRVLETSHPPTYDVPQADVAVESLEPSDDDPQTTCGYDGLVSPPPRDGV